MKRCDILMKTLVNTTIVNPVSYSKLRIWPTLIGLYSYFQLSAMNQGVFLARPRLSYRNNRKCGSKQKAGGKECCGEQLWEAAAGHFQKLLCHVTPGVPQGNSES